MTTQARLRPDSSGSIYLKAEQQLLASSHSGALSFLKALSFISRTQGRSLSAHQHQ